MSKCAELVNVRADNNYQFVQRAPSLIQFLPVGRRVTQVHFSYQALNTVANTKNMNFYQK